MMTLPGIGWEVAQYLLGAPRSNNLVVLARTRGPLQQLQEEYPGQVEVLSGDLANLALGQEAVSLALKAFGRLDGIVINHGILGPVARLEHSDLEEWKSGFDVNFISAVGFVSPRKIHGGYTHLRNSANFISLVFTVNRLRLASPTCVNLRAKSFSPRPELQSPALQGGACMEPQRLL